MDETRVHELRSWPSPYADVVSGHKTFEVRRDDRGYVVGDTLLLREWVPDPRWSPERNVGRYTGREHRVLVTYVFADGPAFGLRDGYAVLGIAPADATPTPAPTAPRTDEDHARYLHEADAARDGVPPRWGALTDAEREPYRERVRACGIEAPTAPAQPEVGQVIGRVVYGGRGKPQRYALDDDAQPARPLCPHCEVGGQECRCPEAPAQPAPDAADVEALEMVLRDAGNAYWHDNPKPALRDEMRRWWAGLHAALARAAIAWADRAFGGREAALRWALGKARPWIAINPYDYESEEAAGIIRSARAALALTPSQAAAAVTALVETSRPIAANAALDATGSVYVIERGRVEALRAALAPFAAGGGAGA